MREILIVYYSLHGSVRNLAEEIGQGVQQCSGWVPRIRTVPRVSAVTEAIEPAIPSEGPPYVELSDLEQCAGLALGSPTRFGSMAASIKYFLDGLSSCWFNGTLVGKPAMVFTSSSTMHGGHEATLMSMLIPLLHQGMLLSGLPFLKTPLSSTKTGGTPYGASHVSGTESTIDLSADEIILAREAGTRLAQLAEKLSGSHLSGSH